MVGALLVHQGRIIGEGYHRKYGEAHAEVNCIASMAPPDRHLIKESTLYVSLEPCSHFGKTPPCTDLIIKNEIRTVVVACTDPYAKVNGSGIQQLAAAGIHVVTGVLEREALELNKRFFTFHRQQRPYIILKWAQSNDHKIAGRGSERTYISSPLTNLLVHKWRSEEAAIMAGTNTVLADDPSLTTRLWPGASPVRIIIDKQLRIPASASVLSDPGPSIIINTIKQEENGNKLFYKTGANENLLAVTLNLLHQRNLLSLLVEGGATLLQSFIDAGLWDEARIITARDKCIGDGLAAPVLRAAALADTRDNGPDKIQFFTNANIPR
jgi:diaminohydroxyphosphoribosylaminopyrimidine deaminase/5-amino-6-(5-phosphoribosylamino)uracil reductase